jgi:tRNA A64-2'-O-ribosylphosphate transferase
MSDESGDAGFYYMSGAADDEESWARHLTPEVFWQHSKELTDVSLSEDEVDERIDQIVARRITGGLTGKIQEERLDRIGSLSLWIGSRRVGRPPQCWENFNVILNVTDQEYEGMSILKEGYYYLQLPVAEGKRDRHELERWMAVGLVYLIYHLQHQRRVLVHCNQGKDRSVAIVLAFVALACPLTFPLGLLPDFFSWKIDELIHLSNSEKDGEQLYRASGLPQATIEALLAESGTETFLLWAHSQTQAPLSRPLADKDRLRIALQLIRQDRPEAEPTRSTMQKLNRFFMSSPMYRQQDL